MIIPLRAACENFLVFKDRQEFTFVTRGLHYIYGVDHDADIDDASFDVNAYNVGVGKTSLAMLQEYAIYGEIQKNVKKDRIINKHTKKNLFVQYDFIHSQTGDQYRIERYRKHETYKDKVFLYKWSPEEGEWKDISALDKSPTQDIISSLAVIDKKTHEKSVLFTRDDKNQFLELSTTLRGEIFENVVQISKLKKYYAQQQKKLKATEEESALVNNEITRVVTLIDRDKKYIADLKKSDETKRMNLNNEIQGINSKILEISNLPKPVNEIVEDLRKHKELSEQRERIGKERTKKADESNKAAKETEEYGREFKARLKMFPSIVQEIKQSDIKALSRIVNHFLAQLPAWRQLDKEIKDLENNKQSIFRRMSEQQERHDNAEAHVQSYTERATKYDKEIKEHLPITCIRCGAVQNQESYDKQHEQLIGYYTDACENRKAQDLKIAICQQQMADLTKQNTVTSVRIQELMNQQLELGIKSEYINNEQALRELPIYQTQYEVASGKWSQAVQEHIVISDELNSVDFQIKELNIPEELLKDPESIQRLSYFNEELKKKTAELESLDITTQVMQLEQEIVKNESERSDWLLKRDLLNKFKAIHEFWITALDFKNENSVKQFVVSRVIPVFNNFVQQMVDAIYHGELNITFDSFFNETILFHGEDYEYDELSTGQKMKLNFCINLAIFDLTRVNLDGCNIIFMDEIFTNIDIPSIVAFLDIIKERYSKDNGVYIISHQSEVRESFVPDSVIRIDKRNWEANVVTE